MTTLLQLLRSGLHPARLPFPVPPAPELDGVPQPAPTVSYDEQWMPRHILQIDSLVSLVTDSLLNGVSNRLTELGKADPVVPAEILQGFEAGFRWFARRLELVRKEDIRVAVAGLMQPLLDLVSFIDEVLELPTDFSDAAVSVEQPVPIPLTRHSALLTDVLLVRRTGDFQGRQFMSSGTIERPPLSQATPMPRQQHSYRLTAPISYEEGSSGRLQRLDTLLRRPGGLAFSRDEWDSETEVYTLVYQASLAAQAFSHRMFYFTDASAFSIAFNCFFGDTRVIAISPLHTLLRPASVAPEAQPSFLVTILTSFFPEYFPNDLLRDLVVEKKSTLTASCRPGPAGSPSWRTLTFRNIHHLATAESRLYRSTFSLATQCTARPSTDSRRSIPHRISVRSLPLNRSDLPFHPRRQQSASVVSSAGVQPPRSGKPSSETPDSSLSTFRASFPRRSSTSRTIATSSRSTSRRSTRLQLGWRVCGSQRLETSLELVRMEARALGSGVTTRKSSAFKSSSSSLSSTNRSVSFTATPSLLRQSSRRLRRGPTWFAGSTSALRPSMRRPAADWRAESFGSASCRCA
ncbi:RHTO0S15e01464g1_1 [Rhodotorula toruloides]|uniref:RHTO0S15e01464g1_1 n=1 Tax=Rhodotorula toruloides TaxID=5286 RepID=A0A061BEF0_RHOTO|nr:RHTO0S15e01464g1_1 [Rhodotorula toruloides]